MSVCKLHLVQQSTGVTVFRVPGFVATVRSTVYMWCFNSSEYSSSTSRYWLMLQGLVALALDSGLVLFQQVFNGPCFFLTSSPAGHDRSNDNMQFYLLLYATYTASKGITVSSGDAGESAGLRLVKHQNVVMYIYPNEELNILVVISARIVVQFDYTYEDFAPFAAAFVALLRKGRCASASVVSNNNSLASLTSIQKQEINDLIVTQFQLHYESNTNVIAMYRTNGAASTSMNIPTVIIRDATVSYERNIKHRKSSCLQMLRNGIRRLGGYSDHPRITVAVPSYSNLTSRDIGRMIDHDLDGNNGDYQTHIIGDNAFITQRRGGLASIKESGILLVWLQLICKLEIRGHNIVQVFYL